MDKLTDIEAFRPDGARWRAVDPALVCVWRPDAATGALVCRWTIRAGLGGASDVPIGLAA